MQVKLLQENSYGVIIYDWCNLHEEYLCGHIKRYPDADEGSDQRFWMFYPIGGKIPMSCSDLNLISRHIGELNKDM